MAPAGLSGPEMEHADALAPGPVRSIWGRPRSSGPPWALTAVSSSTKHGSHASRAKPMTSEDGAHAARRGHRARAPRPRTGPWRPSSAFEPRADADLLLRRCPGPAPPVPAPPVPCPPARPRRNSDSRGGDLRALRV